MAAALLTQPLIVETLEKFKTLKVALIGDICLDLYWFADMTRSELSRETPHFPLPVVRESHSLGSGGNVAANIVALGAASLEVVSVVGPDWRGNLLKEQLAKMGLGTGHLVESPTRCTPAYCKPFRKGISEVEYEDPRIDFDNYAPLEATTEEKVLAALEEAAARCDVLIVCDQNQYGVVTNRVAEAVCRLGKAGKLVVVDSRDRVTRYHHVIVKPNEVEAAVAVGCTPPKGPVEPEHYQAIASELSQKTGRPAVITLGGQGSLWAEGEEVCHIPTVELPPPIDIVGAGDTFISAFSCAYAAGMAGPQALAFANLCSSVTVQKIGQTGVATPQEIIAQFQENAK